MNNRGSMTIIMIGVMPIFTMILFFTLWLFSFMDLRNQIDNICYEYAMKSQETVVSANKKIIALNPVAKTLHYSKKAIKAAIRRKGPDPILVSALAAVKFKQVLLRTSQEAIFTYAKASTIKDGYLVRRKISKKIDNFRKKWNPTSHKSVHIRPAFKGSKIVKDIKDTAPTYKRKKNHETIQTMFIKWSAPASLFAPTSLPFADKIFQLGFRVRGSCASHPHQRRNKWQAAIGKGNHSLNL